MIDVTKDELDRIQDAFKDPGFMGLFKEYMDEISDPEKRALYEKELKIMEEDRGFYVDFLDADYKFSIMGELGVNVMSSLKVEPMNHEGKSAKFPHFVTPEREFMENNVIKRVCDFVFHPSCFSFVPQLISICQDTKNLKGTISHVKIGPEYRCVIRKKKPKYEFVDLEQIDISNMTQKGNLKKSQKMLRVYLPDTKIEDVKISDSNPIIIETNVFKVEIKVPSIPKTATLNNGKLELFF